MRKTSTIKKPNPKAVYSIYDFIEILDLSQKNWVINFPIKYDSNTNVTIHVAVNGKTNEQSIRITDLGNTYMEILRHFKPNEYDLVFAHLNKHKSCFLDEKIIVIEKQSFEDASEDIIYMANLCKNIYSFITHRHLYGA